MNLKMPSDRCMLLRVLLTCWYGSGGQVYIDFSPYKLTVYDFNYYHVCTY